MAIGGPGLISKEENLKFCAFDYLDRDRRFPEPSLSSEGLASLPRSLTFPLQVTSEFFLVMGFIN